MRITRVVGLIVMSLLASVPPALAQTEGRFTGTVMDASGSSVPGAPVIIRNEKTGEERTVIAGPEGRYLIANLKPSTYMIRVAVKDFAPLQYSGLQLLAAQAFPLDLQLQAAGVTEAVTVHGEATSIDLGSARMGVNGKFVSARSVGISVR